MGLKVVFLGTPEFAVPSLKAIINSKHKVLAVVSQPDRELDRKGNLLHTPTKSFALEMGIPFYAFDKISKEGIETIKSIRPDVIVTAAYGQLLSEEFLSIPKLGVFNVHASILPKYRGSSPIQSAILNGENESGVTIMKTVLKMDAGDIFNIERTPINDETTFIQLHDSLKELGAKAITKTLDQLEDGSCLSIPQDENAATYCKKIQKSDGLIDFSTHGTKIVRKINAFNSWPSAFTFIDGEMLKIHSAFFSAAEHSMTKGSVHSACQKDGLRIFCGGGLLNVLSLQLAGKKRMEASEFLRGFHIEKGQILGE